MQPPSRLLTAPPIWPTSPMPLLHPLRQHHRHDIELVHVCVFKQIPGEQVVTDPAKMADDEVNIVMPYDLSVAQPTGKKAKPNPAATGGVTYAVATTAEEPRNMIVGRSFSGHIGQFELSALRRSLQHSMRTPRSPDADQTPQVTMQGMTAALLPLHERLQCQLGLVRQVQRHLHRTHERRLHLHQGHLQRHVHGGSGGLSSSSNRPRILCNSQRFTKEMVKRRWTAFRSMLEEEGFTVHPVLLCGHSFKDNQLKSPEKQGQRVFPSILAMTNGEHHREKAMSFHDSFLIQEDASAESKTQQQVEKEPQQSGREEQQWEADKDRQAAYEQEDASAASKPQQQATLLHTHVRGAELKSSFLCGRRRAEHDIGAKKCSRRRTQMDRQTTQSNRLLIKEGVIGCWQG
ncbi:unnamed protein product [Vitrella brassicaformis CCMP3155]|uniref:Uncharacterized protein n=1 Tax=Vitrella brassicaformis (strain CCMP3155) TaxID=1169540 RepID=A0A0G4EGA4_VITBC|nr:unnamed protein product [Vitrella brassicaformis CCMP3155]|eukprot:CEL94488.1 unnamed protein product [Vitrella brassicaformis CCMP3155]